MKGADALSVAGVIVVAAFAACHQASATLPFPTNYSCVPYHDAVHHGGPQTIPGRLENEYYDVMDVSDQRKRAGVEEGRCYHDTDSLNRGSGMLNGTGSYLAEFRMHEAPGLSFTKIHRAAVAIDDSPYNVVTPDSNSLYLGWIDAKEWVNYTVDVRETGDYTVTTAFTSRSGGHISFDVNGSDVSGPIAIPSTYVAADTVKWRQMHHWNRMTPPTRIHLRAGPQVLTLHFIDALFNFDYMEFVKDAPQSKARQ